MTNKALILANGEPPKKQLLQSLLKDARFIVCADGGANTAAKLGIQPNAIVGDLDSIHAEALVKFHKIPTHESADENSTDLEKAVAWTIQQQYDHITIIGGFGKRLDHTVGNLGVMPKFYPDAIIRFIDDLGEVSYVGRHISFEAKRGDIISLIPLSRCEGVTTQGLQYALDNEALELGVREGTSNVVMSSSVSIKVKKGHLALYKLFGKE
ncbi:MAG: thiamine diphosphokinase [Ignavibacteriales bacterium]|nr:thiamine diphosphokinase [Ignavibacteriales bacterium]